MDSKSVFSRWRWAILSGMLVLFPASALLALDGPSATVVLYNTNDPDSKKLADYYAGRRAIPPDQVVGLACPATEEIQRADYDSSIAAPLRKLFLKHGWWKLGASPAGQNEIVATSVRYLAIMRGMPLKIAPDAALPAGNPINGIPAEITSRNEASVDSELTVLGLPDASPAGILPNPFFHRQAPVLGETSFPWMLLPSRLDGPTPTIVRAMIDDSISAEQSGLWGWAYVDARGITGGGYAEGDQWMANLAASMRSQGLPVIYDRNPETFPPGFPVTDAAVYFGWYAWAVEGPFANPDFQFRRGAIAVHLHSFSAATLLNPAANWCAPLLAHGAAATLGNVYEPYLSLTANLDVFQNCLMAGLPFADSAWISLKALSWMSVAVGDPLYRPYKVWHIPDPPDPGTPWPIYRKIVLGTSGDVLQSADALAEAGRKQCRSFFFEGPGAARMDAGDWAGAVTSFREAAKFATDPAVKVRLDLETVVCLEGAGKKSEAMVQAFASWSKLVPGPRKDLFARFIPQPDPTPSPAPSVSAPPAKPSPVPAKTQRPSNKR